MAPRLQIDAPARRTRLVDRHHLLRTAPDCGTAVESLVAVHSSDPVTPHLAMRARVAGFAVNDLERELYAERSLWRLHAMRRTLFVVAADEADMFAAAAGNDVARSERRKLEGWVAQALGTTDPRPWLAPVEEQTLALLADGRPRRTQELTAAVDGLDLRLMLGSGRWATEAPLSSRLLFVLAMEGRLVRAHPAGSWRSSQYHWAERRSWFAGRSVAEPDGLDPATARAGLVRRWLRAYGPATTADLRWWTGWTARRTEAALAAVAAIEVDLDVGGAHVLGWLLPDDVDDLAAAGGAGGPAQGVALLPGLDPSVMGWAARDWYLDGHAPRLFDRNGNAGPTVWVDGRVVGGWAQRPDGQVVTRLLEDVGADAAAAVDEEVDALTQWFAGIVTTPRFRTPMERELSAAT